MAYDGISAEDLVDFTVATLPHFKKLEFAAPQKYTDYPILNKMLSMGQKNVSGKNAEKRLNIKDSGRAHFTGLYATKEYSKVDTLKKATAPWSFLTTDWMIDRREDELNKGPEQIVSLMLINRQAAEASMANIFEEAAWQTIETEADESASLRGIPYWISKGTSGGYNGTTSIDRSGTSIAAPGGINPGTAGNEYWANYTHSYTNYIDTWIDSGTITNDTLEEDALSLLAAMAITYTKTRFKSPRNVTDLDSHNPLGRYTIYVDTDTMIAYRLICQFFNRGAVNFGYDVGFNQGQASFNGAPLENAPQLDDYADSSITGVHPIYFVNHNVLEFQVVRGCDFYEHKPIILETSGGNVMAINVDLGCQLMCGDRRSMGLVYTS